MITGQGVPGLARGAARRTAGEGAGAVSFTAVRGCWNLVARVASTRRRGEIPPAAIAETRDGVPTAARGLANRPARQGARARPNRAILRRRGRVAGPAGGVETDHHGEHAAIHAGTRTGWIEAAGASRLAGVAYLQRDTAIPDSAVFGCDGGVAY